MEIRLALEKDLDGIHRLNHANLKKNLPNKEIILTEGYVSWEYPVTLLEKMHHHHPSVVAYAENSIIGYALIAVKAARHDHPEFDLVLHKLDTITYHKKPLQKYTYYAMGQVCIAKSHRGQGVFRKLFDAHKKFMQNEYDFVVTTIATANTRSIRAHEQIGFKKIHEFNDHFGHWIVVLWNWT